MEFFVPNEILLDVFNYLAGEEIEKGELVCKRWREFLLRCYKILPFRKIDKLEVKSDGSVNVELIAKRRISSKSGFYRWNSCIDNKPHIVRLLNRCITDRLQLHYLNNGYECQQHRVNSALRDIYKISGRNVLASSCYITFWSTCRIEDVDFQELFSSLISAAEVSLQVQSIESLNFFAQNVSSILNSCLASRVYVSVWNVQARTLHYTQHLSLLQMANEISLNHCEISLPICVSSYGFFETQIQIFDEIAKPETLFGTVNMLYETQAFRTKGRHVVDFNLQGLHERLLVKGLKWNVKQGLFSPNAMFNSAIDNIYTYQRKDGWVLRMTFLHRKLSLKLEVLPPSKAQILKKLVPAHAHYLKYSIESEDSE
uniref:F-box domain-containing protein n=1 Tax=Acrobeloides nanus TaxID=290746 RepID=A0A914EA88_9BILA